MDERLHYEAAGEDSDGMSNELPRGNDVSSQAAGHQVIPASVLERESSVSAGAKPTGVLNAQPSLEKPAEGVRPFESADKEEAHKDLIKAIAYNSREIRIVGPDGKEREMKDDVPTRLVIAMENLQKEASELWSTVNKSLDKGWGEFKTMLEDAVAPKKTVPAKRESSSPLERRARDTAKSSLVELGDDAHGYVMADDSSSVGAKLESAGQKVKGFFTETLGLNENNQKKASDALNKAGTSVSETVTKDIPDALKKAGTAVSDTVTKDIPDAFKNFFG